MNWIQLGTCVAPEGQFVFGLHQPHFQTVNLRENDFILSLGVTDEGELQENQANFPPGDVDEPAAGPIFEVANPFPFRGTTFIGKGWADAAAADPTRITIGSPKKVSMIDAVQQALGPDKDQVEKLFAALPDPVRLALATTSTDANDLRRLAESACRFVYDQRTGLPTGVVFAPDEKGRMRPRIFNHRLYEAVANNPHLNEAYKKAMVLKPGIQGDSEIVGEWRRPPSHVFEYLRRNSYIPWGHYAANMAHGAVRYSVSDLTSDDISGMRHLYYQRTYVRMAQELGLKLPDRRKILDGQSLEKLRRKVLSSLKPDDPPAYTATLWGWNYGFDYAPTGYRLHASHQQVHQQFALIPDQVEAQAGAIISKPAFACGDMVQSFVQQYRSQTGRSFFDCYEEAIGNNQRMDGRSDGPSSLVVYEDSQVVLFVPKAQTSQWELQLMPKKPVGNILEAGVAMRQSLDKAMLVAMRILTALGAAMITTIEYSKRFHHIDEDQRLLYAFLPRLPESPGAFSEAQMRWINGHYPEDFALACRLHLEKALEKG